LSPDFCVRQTETVFAKVGPWSLLFAKFVPGLTTISVAMADVTKMSLPFFFLLSGIGALLFVSVPVLLGWIFQNAITDIVFTLADIGKFGVLAVLAALGLYLLARWWRRRAFIRQLQMDCISVAELRALIDEGQKLLILDVDDSAPAARHATWQMTASRPPGEVRGIDSTDARVALDCRRLV
jgi:hypothetical protein